MGVLEEISEFLQKGRAPKVKELVQQALDEGYAPKEILEGGLLAGMGIIGGTFKLNQVFVPEVLIAARAMTQGVAVLKPRLVEDGVESVGTAVIGTVKGDLHDIGKNLVKMMLESKGIHVVDLGVDVPAERFLEGAKEHNAHVVCCSALLTTTMNEMKSVIDLFQREDYRDRVKIMVGGAPVNEAFAQSIGADGYTPDATSAAELAYSYFSA